MLPAPEPLLHEAYRLLEEHRFAEAVAAFRAAAGVAPLPDWALTNLAIAEGNERVESRRAMARKFPDSVDLALAEVAMLVQARFGPQAIARCTELLARPGLTPGEERRVRCDRFRVACEFGRFPAEFASDFLFLWDGSVAHLARVRLMLLGAVAGLSKPRMLPALAPIREHLGHEADLMRLVAGKAEQLEWLGRLESETRRPRRPAPPDPH